MKASEARKQADAVAATKEKERIEAAEKNRKAAIAKAKQERKGFDVSFNQHIDALIAKAVAEGKSQAEKWVASSYDSPSKAEQNYEAHEYKDIIEATIKRLEDDGYTITTQYKSVYHPDLNNINPGDGEYSYEFSLVISW